MTVEILNVQATHNHGLVLFRMPIPINLRSE